MAQSHANPAIASAMISSASEIISIANSTSSFDHDNGSRSASPSVGAINQ